MSKLARDNRNREIRLIQIARRQLKMSESDYRVMLLEQGGVDSSKDLDAMGRARILQYLTGKGFKPQRSPASKRPRRPEPAPDRKPLVRRIRAQLISLDRKPDEYADGIAKQMLGQHAPEYFEWCEPSDLLKISQALGVEQQRRGAATS